MPESVNLYGGLRLDAPDAAAMQTLMHTADSDVMTHLVGAATTGNHGGVISGMTPGNFPGSGAPYPLNAVPFFSGWVLDSARQVTYHDGVTGTVDMTAIANVNGSKVWARRAAAQLAEDTEDRITIVGSVETQAPANTRLRHVLEFTATTGATPSGNGWVHILTIATWSTPAGVPIPATYSIVFAWQNKGSLWACIQQIVAEILEIKGSASATWESAPAIDLTNTLSTLTALLATTADITSKYLDKKHAEENASATGGIGDGLHIKVAGILQGGSSTLAIVSGRGRGLVSVVRDGTGLYTVTITFGGNPASATIAKATFLPYVGSGNIHVGTYTTKNVMIRCSYTPGATTVLLRITEGIEGSTDVIDLDSLEGVLLEVY